jgi:rhodanese-related sulfurtransferase
MKRFVIIGLLFILVACQEVIVEDERDEDLVIELPVNTSESMLINDSIILPYNLDNYLFLEDVFYVDTREPNQFLEEGHVAGFVNIPFYELIANLTTNAKVLFKINKIFDSNNKLIINLGEVGSYEPIYEESVSILKSIFPNKKKIFIISTAGVESTYLANLLIQYGYDVMNIYNVGNYSNSVGKSTSYRELIATKYKVEGLNAYKITYQFDFGELNKISETD